MALNKETFRIRSLSAIAFVVVMLSGLFIHGYVFLALCLLIMTGCFVEYIRLIKKIHGDKYASYVVFGILYTVLPLLFLAHLGYSAIATTPEGDKMLVTTKTYKWLLPAAVIFSMWVNDTMAYIVGSLIGKTPFSKISPKKTWEGTAGGAILCVAVMTWGIKFLPGAQALSTLNWAIIFTICAVMGTLGDLFESKLKRMAGVKDSGNIMPGHGGFLDRFDSLLFAATAVWLYLRFLV